MARCFPLVVALSLVGCAAGEPAEELGRRAAGLTPVAWTDLVGVSAAINDLTKTAPESAWNAGAVSVQALAGDGLVEFTAGESTTDKAIGLSVGNGGEKMSDIDFAIRLNASGRAIVYEGGESRGGIGTYAPGVVFRVQAEDGVVTYWRNGVLRYTSELAPTFPLLVDTSLRTPGATLRNVRIEPIDFWTAGVGVDIDRRDIVKTASEDQFNAGAASLGSIPSGDGYVEFRAADETSIVAAGLSRGNNNQSRTDIDFAIQPNHGTIAIYERGVLVDTFGPYRAGDLFQVEVSAGQVRYYHDRVLLHTSAQAPSYPLLLDASIRTPGASILGAKLVAGYTADGCIPVQQTLSEAARQADAEGDVLVLAESEAVPPVAKVYRKTPVGWMFEQALPEPAGPPQTGWASEAITDGETIAVRGYRHVQLYRHDGIQWVESSRIEGCSVDFAIGPIALAGDLLAVSDSSPAQTTRVYRRAADVWILDALLVRPNAGGSYGSPAVGGDRFFGDGWFRAVDVFRYRPGLADPPPTDPCGAADPGKWRFETKILPPPDHDYDGVVADRAGRRLLVHDGGFDALRDDMHVLELDGGTWIETARLVRTPFEDFYGGSFELGGPGGGSVAAVGGSASWLYGDLDDGWALIGHASASNHSVSITEDTMVSVLNGDRVQIRGIDPACLAQ